MDGLVHMDGWIELAITKWIRPKICLAAFLII